MREIIISSYEQNQRIDKYLFKYFNKAPKSFVYKMLRKKRIKCNNKRVKENSILKEGDVLQIYLSEDTINEFSKVDINKNVNITFDIIYEDENILICNKPVGLLAQKNSSSDDSLVDQVTAYLINTKQYNPYKVKGYKPGICNRLDRNTSGIVLVGKNINTLQSLNNLIKQKKIEKYYSCIVKGKIKNNMILEDYLLKNKLDNKVEILKNPSKKVNTKIKTIINPIKYNNKFSLLKIQLITGKTHQIRAHLSSIGHPILGDPKYGDKQLNKQLKDMYSLTNQLLHAEQVIFKQTDNYLKYLQGKMFKAEEPKIIKKIKNKLFY